MKNKLNQLAKHPFFRIIIIIIIILLLLTRCEYGPEHGTQQHQTSQHNKNQGNHSNNTTPNEKPSPADVNDNKGSSRPAEIKFKGKKVALTKHAKCRMDCREIDAYEIQEIIDKNMVNQRKSTPSPANGKCPTIAYEGKSRDNQQIRVIVGDCDEPIIITVIDLKNEYQCACK